MSRHLRAIFSLPFVALVIIPSLSLLFTSEIDTRWDMSILMGESVVTGSRVILLWTVLFFTLNHFYFIFSEEPGLEKRFGEPYKRYKQNVPRWIPRSTPWTESKENAKSKI